MLGSEGLVGLRWDNCPPLLQTRLLGLHREAQTASPGAMRHFIYPQVDEVLDEWLDHLTYVEWISPQPEVPDL